MVRNNSLMHYANYLFILSVCIDQGDGRWKEREKETPKNDIYSYRELAEKLEDQMETFYEDYPDDTLRHFHIQNVVNRRMKDIFETSTKEDDSKYKLVEILYFATTVRPPYLGENSDVKMKSFKLADHFDRVFKTNNRLQKGDMSSGWPKFEEILRAIGVKYDWKNDRWIKIKQKINKRINDGILAQNNSEHEKHNFKYKLVKLNRGMTLIPWKLGRRLVWGATCVDTLAPSHLPKTSQEASGVQHVLQNPLNGANILHIYEDLAGRLKESLRDQNAD